MIKDELLGFFIADIHFGNSNKDDEHLYYELDEKVIKRINKYKEKLDFIIIGGDFYDRELGMNEKAGKMASKFMLTLNNLSIKYDFKLLVIKGTLRHDYNQLEVFRKLEINNPNFKLFNTATVYEFDSKNNIYFLMLPEEYVENEDEFYSEFLELEEDSKYDFIFSHATFDFAGYISKISTSEKQVKQAVTFKSKNFKDLTYGCTLSGHVHTRCNDNNVYYSGSFSRFAFGEDDDKGFYEIRYNINSLETKLNFIKNDLAPTYITVDASLLPKDIVERSKRIKELQKEYDHVRFQSTQTYNNEEDLKLLKEFAETQNNIKVDFKKAEEEELEDHTFDFILNREKDIPETVKDFIQIKTGEELTIEEIEEVLNYNSGDE